MFDDLGIPIHPTHTHMRAHMMWVSHTSAHNIHRHRRYVYKHTVTHTYTYTPQYVHQYWQSIIWTCTSSQAGGWTGMHACTHMHEHSQIYIHGYTHTRMNTVIQPGWQAYTPKLRNTYIPLGMHAYRYTRAHACMGYTPTHTYIHMITRIHTCREGGAHMHG